MTPKWPSSFTATFGAPVLWIEAAAYRACLVESRSIPAQPQGGPFPRPSDLMHLLITDPSSPFWKRPQVGWKQDEPRGVLVLGLRFGPPLGQCDVGSGPEGSLSYVWVAGAVAGHSASACMHACI